jgi:hypothetical protein
MNTRLCIILDTTKIIDHSMEEKLEYEKAEMNAKGNGKIKMKRWSR